MRNMNTNTKKLSGKVAVVTGASKGIGADIAKHFAAEGAAVVGNYASSKEGADRVVDQITKQGGKAIAVKANVAKKAEVEQLLARRRKFSARSTSWLTTPECTNSPRWKRLARNSSTNISI
jgi:3-oxoacyl-[acyl-carrier protein] reductase